MLVQLDAEPSCLSVCMQTTHSPFAEDICWNRCSTKELLNQKPPKNMLMQLDLSDCNGTVPMCCFCMGHNCWNICEPRTDSLMMLN